MKQDQEFEAWWATQSHGVGPTAYLMREAAKLAWDEAKLRSNLYRKVMDATASAN